MTFDNKKFSCSFLNAFVTFVETVFCRIRAVSSNFRVLEMTKLKKLLTIVVIVLSVVNLSEISYFAYKIAENHRELTLRNLLITAFINLAGLFFVLTLFIGIAQSNEALLKTWIVYAIFELSRSSIILYATWAEPRDDNFEKIFNTCDVVVQTLLILVVLLLLYVLRVQRKSEKQISTIERSLAMHEMAQASQKTRM